MQLSFVTESGPGLRPLTTVAEALQRLTEDPAGFRPENQAIFNVANLANGPMLAGPALLFVPYPTSERVFSALLAPATHCWGTDFEGGSRAKYDVRLLHGAVVNHEGHLTLGNGTKLRAVEVIPVPLSSPSDLDWRILKAFIAARGAESRCYRGVLDGLEPEFVAQMPHLAAQRRIDCSRLSGLKPQLLKQDLHAVREQDPTLDISEEKLAQTLAMFGIRSRRTRRRAS